MGMSVIEIYLLMLMSWSRAGEMPPDALALVEPAAGLELLGQPTDPDGLRKIIESGDAAAAAGSAMEAKEIERAIENLASSSDAIRSKSREKLVRAGAAAKARLEEVVAKDARRADEARKVLEQIARASASSEHDGDVARTLAIRLAVEKELKELVPAIRKAYEASENPFVKFAAEDALIKLGDKAPPPEDTSTTGTTEPASAPPLPEVDALSPETRLLVSVRLDLPEPGAKGKTLRELMTRFTAGFPVDAEDIEEAVREGTQEILNWVRAYGNMRPQRAIIANVGGITEEGGGLGIIVQGVYEPAILRAALGSGGSMWTSSDVAGYTVYNSPFLRVAILGDQSVLLLPIMASKDFPLDEYLKNLKEKKSTLVSSPRLAQFRPSLDAGDPVRALAITDAALFGELHREMERNSGVSSDVTAAFKALKELEGTVTPLEGGDVRVRIEGVFEDEKHATKLTEYLKAQIATGIAEMERTMQEFPMPMFKTWLEIMKKIKLSAEGKRGVFRLELPADELESIFGVAGMRAG